MAQSAGSLLNRADSLPGSTPDGPARGTLAPAGNPGILVNMTQMARGRRGAALVLMGIFVIAVGMLNAMQNFALPTNCNLLMLAIKSRTVTNTLGGPAGAPWNGTAGLCNETPLTITGAQAAVFGGLNALLYTYNMQSAVTKNLGFKEVTINNQFQAHLIPMFQVAAFNSADMEVLPGPTAILNGRLHTDGDMHLNNDTCGSAPNNGLNIRPWCLPSGRGSSPQHPLKGDEGPLPFPYGLPYSAPAFTLSATESIDRARHAVDLLRMIPKQDIEVLNTERPSGIIPMSTETAQSVREVRGREIPAPTAHEVALKEISAEDAPDMIRR
jgi:hypothetical protein